MYSSKSIRCLSACRTALSTCPLHLTETGRENRTYHQPAFTVGTTGNRGVVTMAPVGVTAASEAAITDIELVDLVHSVDPAYRGQAEFMFNDQTLRELKKLRDAEGRPLWLPGIAVREPDTILGYRYVINTHMPVMEPGAKSVLFGDFSKYYIRDVMDITLVRLDEVYAEYGQVAFLAFSRHDGALLDAGTNPIRRCSIQHLRMRAV